MVALALLPSVVPRHLAIVDATAHRIAGLQNCVFVESIPVDAEIVFQARLMEGHVNADGFVVYTLEFAWRIAGYQLPCIVGELLGMATRT